IYDDELEDFVDLEPGTSVHNKAKIKLTKEVGATSRSLVLQTFLSSRRPVPVEDRWDYL
ncbi:hypothetical protein MTO96_042010, partial [Rhipicephalus appendiculatus]